MARYRCTDQWQHSESSCKTLIITFIYDILDTIHNALLALLPPTEFHHCWTSRGVSLLHTEKVADIIFV